MSPATQAAQEGYRVLEDLRSVLNRLMAVVEVVDPALAVHVSTMATAAKAIIGGFQEAQKAATGYRPDGMQSQPAEAAPGV